MTGSAACVDTAEKAGDSSSSIAKVLCLCLRLRVSYDRVAENDDLQKLRSLDCLVLCPACRMPY